MIGPLEVSKKSGLITSPHRDPGVTGGRTGSDGAVPDGASRGVPTRSWAGRGGAAAGAIVLQQPIPRSAHTGACPWLHSQVLSFSLACACKDVFCLASAFQPLALVGLYSSKIDKTLELEALAR